MYYDKWWKSHGRWPESGDCEFASKFCLSKMGLMTLLVNVSRMSSKLLQTQPHIVENKGIAMAPLFLRLTS